MFVLLFQDLINQYEVMWLEQAKSDARKRMLTLPICPFYHFSELC